MKVLVGCVAVGAEKFVIGLARFQLMLDFAHFVEEVKVVVETVCILDCLIVYFEATLVIYDLRCTYNYVN